MSRLWTLLIAVRSSLWFVPMGMVLIAIAFAFGLVELDSYSGFDLGRRWPRLFGAGAEGSRTLLAAIATSMITVAGIGFSLTMVALSLAANQYSSRVLRNFMRDRSNQFVLGTFVSIFTYCLLVLRTIRDGATEHVPSVSVVGAIVLALFGIVVLIYFIHHVAASMQVSTILAAISEETLGALQRLFPESIGDDLDEQEGTAAEQALLQARSWQRVLSRCAGYIQTIRPEPLLSFAHAHDVVIHLDRSVGEYVGKRARLASVSGSAEVSEALVSAVNNCFGVSSYRTIEQDPAFGIRQIVDIAAKALSPGINDPTTAVNCLDHLESILRDLVQRRIPSPFRYHQGQLRVIALRPGFECLLDQILRELTVYGRSHYAVVRRMLDMLISVVEETRMVCRRRLLARYGRLIMEEAGPHLSPRDRADVAARLQNLELLLQSSSADAKRVERPEAER